MLLISAFLWFLIDPTRELAPEAENPSSISAK
jgi:hypothetical protein